MRLVSHALTEGTSHSGEGFWGIPGALEVFWGGVIIIIITKVDTAQNTKAATTLRGFGLGAWGGYKIRPYVKLNTEN